MGDEQGKSMTAFVIVWLGQFVSMLGSAMTGFALTIWVWELTGRATALALMGFFAFAPAIIVIPLAGALVDRWDRKLVMMLSDLSAAISTILILVLIFSDSLALWHLYALGAFASIFGAFQFPAYSAAATMMVPKKHYARMSGMISTAGSAVGIISPILAPLVLITIGIKAVLMVDLGTFLFAIGVLAFVKIPNPKVSKEGAAARQSLWKDSLFGFKYIFSKKGLRGIQTVFFFFNLTAVFAMVLFASLVLKRSPILEPSLDKEYVFGIIQSVGAIGSLIGGIILMIWGGPKNKILGILGGMIISMVFGVFLFGISGNIYIWAIAMFIMMFCMPIVNGSSQAFWQSKVPPDIQGRVFSARAFIAQIASPISMISSGLLADYIFEPAMDTDGALADSFGWLVGTGPGAGMALMFVIVSLLASFVAIIGLMIPSVRNAESLISDYEEDTMPVSENDNTDNVE